MPPDDVLQPGTRNDRRAPAPVQQTVNLGETPRDGGIQGMILKYAQTSIVTFFLLVSVWLMHEYIVQGRADRVEDRQLFRESVHEIQRDADRRAGEVKGSTDKLVEVVRQNSDLVKQWIEESRRARAERGAPPRTAELKPPMSP